MVLEPVWGLQYFPGGYDSRLLYNITYKKRISFQPLALWIRYNFIKTIYYIKQNSCISLNKGISADVYLNALT
jgi:hypothetical protein